MCGGVYLGKAGGTQGSSCYDTEEIMAPGQVRDSPVAACPCPISIPSMDKLDRFLLILSSIRLGRRFFETPKRSS